MPSVLSNGYFTIGRLRGIPIRVHVATPVGLFVFSGFSFNPVVWAAILFIIFVHELGHAAIVRRYGLRIVSVDFTGIGGECRWLGQATPIQESVIAWGGVLAQACLLAIAVLAARLHVFQGNTWAALLAETLVSANVFLIAFNLLPMPPFDGAKAWLLFRPSNFLRLGRRRFLKSKLSSMEAELERIRRDREKSGSSCVE